MALGAGVTVVMLRAALPLLVKVTFWAALATPTLVEKVRLEALRPTSGPVPVPLRLTVCVLLATLLLLSVRVSVAVWELLTVTAVGVKVTLMVQVPLAATGAPQVLV